MVLIVQGIGIVQLSSEEEHFVGELCFVAFDAFEPLRLRVDGLSHITDLIPVIRVVPDDIYLKVKQVDLVLGLENGDLAGFSLQLHLSLLQLLDLSLGSKPVVFDLLSLAADRLKLVLNHLLLRHNLLQLQAQLAAQLLVLGHLFLFLLQLVLNHGKLNAGLSHHLVDELLLLLRHGGIDHLDLGFIGLRFDLLCLLP